MSNFDEWEPPPMLDRVRRPEIGRAWLERIRSWERENAELSHLWAEALCEDADRRRAAQELAIKRQRLKWAGLGDRAIETLERGMKETPATMAVETYLQSGKTFLLLMGSAGAGKTLAGALAISQTPGAILMRALELARLSVYDDHGRAMISKVHNARMLVLDDLGAELLHDGWRPLLDELIDVRWAERRRTIITTNLDGASFKTRYGVRIADRIRDDGFVETCGDKSRRGQGAQ